MADWYQEHLVDTGRSPALWLLIGFLLTFGITRGITVMIRNRTLRGQDDSDAAIKDVIVGGVHIHHQVWGILLLLVTGILEFRFRPDHPWVEVIAALFGVGAALTLDEFALWLHLEDVYWSAEGRKSIDAIMVAGVVGLGLLMNASPIGLQAGSVDRQGLWFVSAFVIVHIGYTVVCMLKGKLVTGLVGLPVPVFSLVGSIRLAKPTSFWAKRFYDENKMARSVERFAHVEHKRLDAVKDRLAGPGPDPAV
jgi:hypothetical protein